MFAKLLAMRISSHYLVTLLRFRVILQRQVSVMLDWNHAGLTPRSGLLNLEGWFFVFGFW